MKSVLNILSGVILIAAIGFALAAIGNGKIGTLFGTEVFIASGGDMKAAFVALIAAVPALIWLLVSLRLSNDRVKKLKDVRDQWEAWHRNNSRTS